jgi:hypothetical protein
MAYVEVLDSIRIWTVQCWVVMQIYTVLSNSQGRHVKIGIRHDGTGTRIARKE